MTRDELTDAIELALRYKSVTDVVTVQTTFSDNQKVAYYPSEFAYKVGLWWQSATDAGITLDEEGGE